MEKTKIQEALSDPEAPWYGSDLVAWVADLLEESAQLQADLDKAKAENEKLKAEKRRLRSGLGILIQNWISVQKISDEGYIEESDVILSNAKQALSGQEGS